MGIRVEINNETNEVFSSRPKWELLKDNFLAFSIDTLLWAYTILVCYKVIYEKVIMGMRYPIFDWNQPLLALAVGVVLAGLFYLSRLSIGRATLGLMPLDPNKTHSN